MPSNNERIMDTGAMINAWSSIRAIILSAVETMGRLAIGFAPTKRIGTAIIHGVKVTSDNNIVAYIGVDVQKAPEAAALEFGSGLWATRGPRRKYPIDPKPSNPNQALVFNWKNEPEFIKSNYPHTRDGKVIIPHVEHPGVVAKPFLAPAFDSLEKESVIAAIDKAIQSSLGMDSKEIVIKSEVLIL
jgi:hypothetical protein